MGVVGMVLAVFGLLLLVAGVLARLGDRVGDDSSGGRSRPYLRLGEFLAVPLLIVGLLLADLRRLPDQIGVILLAGTLALIVIVLTAAVVRRRNGDGSTAGAVLTGVAATTVLAGTVAIVLAVKDLVSVLVLWGFLFVLLGVVAVIVGLGWLLVALIRRGDRRGARRFTWTAVSVVVACVVGIVAIAPRPPSVPDRFADTAELDDYLEELVDSGMPPGVSVVVVADGVTVYDKAFGVSDGLADTAAEPDNVYRWYSATKVVTAIATLQLVERGLLSLDDPVSEHLSFFAPTYPSDSSPPVTIGDLLNHSAGLPQNVPAVIGWLRHEDEPTLDQTEFLRDRLPSYDDLLDEPGSQGVYTNVGYYSLGAVIEQASGQRYEDYVIENVLEPLGMDNTRYRYTEAMVANEAVGAHPMANLQTLFVPVMDPPWPTSYIRTQEDGWIWFERFLFEGNAPSGLIGPAPEMSRLVSMVLNGGELDGQRVLSEESVDTLLFEHHVVAGKSPEMNQYADYDEAVHGIGWFVVTDGDRTFHAHGGGGPAFAAYMRLYAEEDLAIVVMANGTNLPSIDLADAIADLDW
jgi:CubicO group peptidase (beta-lactamase class C family)